MCRIHHCSHRPQFQRTSSAQPNTPRNAQEQRVQRTAAGVISFFQKASHALKGRVSAKNQTPQEATLPKKDVQSMGTQAEIHRNEEPKEARTIGTQTDPVQAESPETLSFSLSPVSDREESASPPLLGVSEEETSTLPSEEGYQFVNLEDLD